MNLINLNYYDINSVIRRLPNKVVDYLKSDGNVFLCGGFIRSVIANEPINDIDILVSGEARERAKVLFGEFHSSGNAYSAKINEYYTQLIHRWTFNSMEEAIESFDYTIACAGICWYSGHWVGKCHENYYQDLAAKRLIYLAPNREEAPGGSMLRLLKFYSRGYRAPLDSVAGIVARLYNGVKPFKTDINNEAELSKVLAGLLFEVDPNAVGVTGTLV